VAFADFKKYIPGQGSGKEFLKQEIERMIMILKKKHEVSMDVHVFRKPDPKNTKDIKFLSKPIEFEEVQNAVASLFS
jgi:hypothetical protein